MPNIRVFVKLLEEGTLVFRPTEGEIIDGSKVKLFPTSDYNPEDEKWEFLPGSVVCCEYRMLGNEKALIAVSKVS
jgi:hypothetical protein